MTCVNLRNEAVEISGDLPEMNKKAPDFCLTDTDLMPVRLSDFKDTALLLNIYPSLDTHVCYTCARCYHDADRAFDNAEVLCISVDTPFALKRIAHKDAFENIHLLSDYKTRDFGHDYGLILMEGPMAGFLARAVVVLDRQHNIVYEELVSELTDMPDCHQSIEALRQAALG